MASHPDQLGPYTIDREIGRGGMGVVYLGRDSRLDRDVAIKALPEHFASDPERLARFEREARTLASLSHPNVAGIYGVEEHDGAKYLILEYVEGETLADRLDRGPMPVDEVIEIMMQIAAGVEAAHEQGVIHRDLKPANVKITPEGRVKVLDFGLSKIDDGASSSGSGMSQLPTISSPAQHSPTIPGAILGTAPYMSPEQARGRRVDKRSDVWSFGCVLYECLTGERLFMGETATDSIGAILHKEIDLGLLPSETPVRVRELLARTLERDKERRLRDLGDASLDLEAAKAEIGTGLVLAGNARRGLGWGSALALVGVAASITGAGVWVLAHTPEQVGQAPPMLPRFTMMQLTDRVGEETRSSISPDGSTIVYEAIDGDDTDIFSQRVGGFNATNLTPKSESEDYAPKFSPDGQSIAFCSTRDGGGIFIMGATGESPRRLTNFGFNPAWSPDGKQLAFATELIVNPLSRNTTSELWVVDTSSGQTTRIYEGDAVQPDWSPSGARIACWRTFEGGQRDMFTIAPDGTNFVDVTHDRPSDWNPVWSPDGKWIYFSSDRGGSFSIWRIAIDEGTGVISGEPERVTTATAEDAGWLSFSRDGKRLVFSSMSELTSIMRLNLDAVTGKPSGDPVILTPFTTNVGQHSISPDGRFIAYANSGERQEDLFIISSDGTGRRRLTNDAAKDRGPVWMGSGDRLAFYSDRNGDYQAWSIRTDGGGLELLAEMKEGFIASLVSPDGKYLAGINSDDGATLLLRLDQDGSSAPLSVLAPQDGTKIPIPLDWSSDSAKLLVQWFHEDFTTVTLAVLDVASGVSTSIRSATAVIDGRFYSDSRYVLVRDGTNLLKIDSQSGESNTIYQGVSMSDFGSSFDLAPDDSWICYTKIVSETDIWMIEFDDE